MKKKEHWHYFPRTISKKQATDSGMAAVLILLLIGLFTTNDLYYKIAIPVLVIAMTFPMAFYPFAILWFGCSQLLGTIMSKLILTIVYIFMVIPVGMIRRLMGKDTLQLSEFKKSKSSVMHTREYNFTSKDIENPY
jgi:ABC-type nitrate/sulfonate/bicarbonate transport system permease component